MPALGSWASCGVGWSPPGVRAEAWVPGLVSYQLCGLGWVDWPLWASDLLLWHTWPCNMFPQDSARSFTHMEPWWCFERWGRTSLCSWVKMTLSQVFGWDWRERFWGLGGALGASESRDGVSKPSFLGARKAWLSCILIDLCWHRILHPIFLSLLWV